ncbi:MAG: hypothetical protein GF408_03745 [Candidatus Omnitrophica bacterium]|nr:hypothetical protein [Candidatus Omnitrophota bacterium]
MKKKNRIAGAALSLWLLAVLSGTAAAEENVQEDLPRSYLAQLRQINKEYREGSLTRTEYIQRKRDLDARYDNEGSGYFPGDREQ